MYNAGMCQCVCLGMWWRFGGLGRVRKQWPVKEKHSSAYQGSSSTEEGTHHSRPSATTILLKKKKKQNGFGLNKLLCLTNEIREWGHA